MVLDPTWRRGWQIENRRQNVGVKVGPVQPDATRYRCEQRHDGMLGKGASLDGRVFTKGVLMSDSQDWLPFEFASPGGDRFVVSDNQIVGFDIESLHIASELLIAIGHDGLSISKPASFCDKGEPGAVLEVPERLHVKQTLSRST